MIRGIAAVLALSAAMGATRATSAPTSPAPTTSAVEAFCARTSDLGMARDEMSGAELKPRETNCYEVSLARGQGLLVLVEQTSVDVALALRGPGEDVAVADARSSGLEPLVAAVTIAGSYQLRVSGSSPDK